MIGMIDTAIAIDHRNAAFPTWAGFAFPAVDVGFCRSIGRRFYAMRAMIFRNLSARLYRNRMAFHCFVEISTVLLIPFCQISLMSRNKAQWLTFDISIVAIGIFANWRSLAATALAKFFNHIHPLDTISRVYSYYRVGWDSVQ